MSQNRVRQSQQSQIREHLLAVHASVALTTSEPESVVNAVSSRLQTLSRGRSGVQKQRQSHRRDPDPEPTERHTLRAADGRLTSRRLSSGDHHHPGRRLLGRSSIFSSSAARLLGPSRCCSSSVNSCKSLDEVGTDREAARGTRLSSGQLLRLACGYVSMPRVGCSDGAGIGDGADEVPRRLAGRSRAPRTRPTPPRLRFDFGAPLPLFTQNGFRRPHDERLYHSKEARHHRRWSLRQDVAPLGLCDGRISRRLRADGALRLVSRRLRADGVAQIFENYVAEIRLDGKPVQLALWDTACARSLSCGSDRD